MKHLKIQVQGIVQGVGFRPFVHRLALQNNLKGYAYNDAQGIIIHIQGNSKDTDIFLEQLKSQAPVLSKIENLEVKECPIESFNDFQIKESQNGIHQTLISPDIAPCEDCIHEMLDPNNRRFHYPFINCTNCGPRYSIIQDIPYDRKIRQCLISNFVHNATKNIMIFKIDAIMPSQMPAKNAVQNSFM